MEDGGIGDEEKEKRGVVERRISIEGCQHSLLVGA